MNRLALLSGIVLLVSPAFSQSTESAPALPKRMHIRAVLEKTVDTNKAKPGDLVRMRVLAAEMDGRRVLIAKDAKLVGRVVESVPLGGAGSESRLMVVMERATWKRHSVELHAFIVAQGVLQRRTVMDATESDCRFYQYRQAPPGTNCTEAEESGKITEASKESPKLTGVAIVGVESEGPTMLVSKTKNVVLPEQTVVLLRNVVSNAPR